MLDIARDYDDAFSVDSSVMNPRFQIVLCELYNPQIHGFDENSHPHISSHYLVHSRYKYTLPYNILGEYDNDNRNNNNNNNYYSDSSDDEEEDSNIFEIIPEFKRHLRRDILPYNRLTTHPFIRNYKAIISNENYIKPEIAECLYLSGDEFVAILKTFWIRIVQRAWRRVFQERKQIIARRMRIDSLSHREIMGKWPSSCNHLPSIHGMLFQKHKFL
jgi:hypothetical protein